ncbi:DUF4139 domain-containing protein [Pinirhizobacter soli]|uniref:DUF4139 domain-containing protein n=1 Tax=Pinirhizobacter soli TaxID=2786953 RepID=UPI002029EFEC
MIKRPLACLLGFLAATPVAFAADGVNLTIYRADGAELFGVQANGPVQDGYAVVHEKRDIALTGGTQDIVLGGFPYFLDTEALSLRFSGKARVASQRLTSAAGGNATLAAMVGKQVTVIGTAGQPITTGTLLRAGDGLQLRDGTGSTIVVRDFAAVSSHGDFPDTGATLTVRVADGSAGNDAAALDYPTQGLGWRASYIGTLAAGSSCRMSFQARASVANRSGRDWTDAQVKLVAGSPNMEKPVAYANAAPAPMMRKAGLMAMDSSSTDVRQQTLGDYRTYTLPGAVSLPDGSISQVPLYATRDVACERESVYELPGTGFQSGQPMINRSFNLGDSQEVTSKLRFDAFDTLPAGYLRVLTVDRDGNAELLGETRMADTPKGEKANVVLGNAIDLRGKNELTTFNVDQAAHRMDEGRRITLSNGGDEVKTVTVIVHPYRWNHWKLVSSSAKPTKQTPDTLEFHVDVPANGKTTLDYAVTYNWTAADAPAH